MSSAASTERGGRVAWLDLARAGSIVLVVVYHVAVGAGEELMSTGESLAGRVWVQANLALVPLRMPLFFAVSGALAVNAVHRPWPAVRRPRILDLLWPYLVWSLLFAATAWPRFAPDDAAGFVRGEVRAMLVAASPYWFIAVLPIFFLIARAGRSRPRTLLVLALLAYAAAPFATRWMQAAALSPDLVYGTFQLLDNAVWFMLGVAARDRILTLGAVRRPGRGAALVGAFGVLALAILVVDVPLAVLRSMELLASVSGLLACALLLPVIGSQRWAARIGAHLGRRTLVIYLVHPLVINAVVLVWQASGAEQWVGPTVRALVLVPAVTALAIGAALLFDAVIARCGPHWLLEAPGARRARTSRAALRASS